MDATVLFSHSASFEWCVYYWNIAWWWWFHLFWFKNQISRHKEPVRDLMLCKILTVFLLNSRVLRLLKLSRTWKPQSIRNAFGALTQTAMKPALHTSTDTATAIFINFMMLCLSVCCICVKWRTRRSALFRRVSTFVEESESIASTRFANKRTISHCLFSLSLRQVCYYYFIYRL